MDENVKKYFSNLPNTTQIPNALFDQEMIKMKDTELRVVLIVARKTLGWLIDIETGMRKRDDWISKSQLVKFSGRSNKSLASALTKCISQDWIEARDISGNLLDTATKRRAVGQGGKIFYRLGKKFLPSAEECKNYTASKEHGKNYLAKTTHYKTNLYTKEESSFLKKYEGVGIDAIQELKKGSKPTFWGLDMRWSKGKWWVLPKDGSTWQEFSASEKDIEWK